MYLSNGEGYEDTVLFSKTHEVFLREYIELKNGIPSHDIFNRVFSLLEPDIIQGLRQGCNWILVRETDLFGWEEIAWGISGQSWYLGLIHINAWVAENRLCIGQKKVEDKSNEITALPSLINEIDIEEAVVSIDAIGCQKAIAQQIKERTLPAIVKRESR